MDLRVLRPYCPRTDFLKPPLSPGKGVFRSGRLVRGYPEEIGITRTPSAKTAAEANEIAPGLGEVVRHPPAGGHASLGNLLAEDQAPGPPRIQETAAGFVEGQLRIEGQVRLGARTVRGEHFESHLLRA